MKFNDPETMAIADLYNESFSTKGGLVGSELVSALVTSCMSKWFELTAKFRSRPEVYDVADSSANDAYNVMKMTPGADVRDDVFEAISKATNDITKELNRLFGSDVFEPRISRLEGKLEALVAFKNAKGGVFQAKGEPSEGHTTIHLTMPKETELERAFSAMTDTPHTNDGSEGGLDGFEDPQAEPIASDDPAPQYDPEFDVKDDMGDSEIDDEYGDLDDMDDDDPMDDLSADEADAMFADEPRRPRREGYLAEGSWHCLDAKGNSLGTVTGNSKSASKACKDAHGDKCKNIKGADMNESKDAYRRKPLEANRAYDGIVFWYRRDKGYGYIILVGEDDFEVSSSDKEITEYPQRAFFTNDEVQGEVKEGDKVTVYVDPATNKNDPKGIYLVARAVKVYLASANTKAEEPVVGADMNESKDAYRRKPLEADRAYGGTILWYNRDRGYGYALLHGNDDFSVSSSDGDTTEHIQRAFFTDDVLQGKVKEGDKVTIYVDPATNKNDAKGIYLVARAVKVYLASANAKAEEPMVGESFENDILSIISEIETHIYRGPRRLGDEFFEDVVELDGVQSDFQSLYQESYAALSAPQSLQEFSGRNRAGKVKKNVSGGEIIRFVNKFYRQSAGNTDDNYEIFLAVQLPEAVLGGLTFAPEALKVSKQEFMEDINRYFDPEEFDWEDDNAWPVEDMDFDIPAPEQIRTDLLEFLSRTNWNPVSHWAEEMLAAAASSDPIDIDIDIDAGPEPEMRHEQREAGFRVRIKGKDGDRVSQIFDTQREAEQFRRRDRDFKDGTVEPVEESVQYKTPAQKRRAMKENAPAVSVAGATAAGSSPSPDQVKNIGKKKSKVLKRDKKKDEECTKESLDDMDIINNILGSDIRFN